MRYHFIVNGYTNEVLRQMEEQLGFAEEYLSGMEQGEAIIYCSEAKNLYGRHAREAVFVRAKDYVPETVLE